MFHFLAALGGRPQRDLDDLALVQKSLKTVTIMKCLIVKGLTYMIDQVASDWESCHRP